MTRLRPVVGAPAVLADGLTVVRTGATLLDRVALEVPARDHLAVLGPNGAGKTTLLRILGTYLFPTRGWVEVLGHRLGRVDVRALRPEVGTVSVSLDPLLEPIGVRRLVAGSSHGALAPPHLVLEDPAAVAAADRALDRVAAGHLAERRVTTLSQGERQRVRIARALASEPTLLLLDEPFAGLDVGARERLLGDLDGLLADPAGPTVVLVTHHLEELPSGVRRGLLLADGRAVASGPVDEVLTSERVSAAFATPLTVDRSDDGRWRAVGARGRDESVRFT